MCVCMCVLCVCVCACICMCVLVLEGLPDMFMICAISHNLNHNAIEYYNTVHEELRQKIYIRIVLIITVCL